MLLLPPPVLPPLLPLLPLLLPVSLRGAGPAAFFDAISMLDDAGRTRLAHYAAGGVRPKGPLPGFWTATELAPPV